MEDLLRPSSSTIYGPAHEQEVRQPDTTYQVPGNGHDCWLAPVNPDTHGVSYQSHCYVGLNPAVPPLLCHVPSLWWFR